jgi:hypothetical protein
LEKAGLGPLFLWAMARLGRGRGINRVVGGIDRGPASARFFFAQRIASAAGAAPIES